VQHYRGTKIWATFDHVANTAAQALTYALVCRFAGSQQHFSVASRSGVTAAPASNVTMTVDMQSYISASGNTFICRVLVGGGVPSNEATVVVPFKLPTLRLELSAVYSMTSSSQLVVLSPLTTTSPVVPLKAKLNITDIHTGQSHSVVVTANHYQQFQQLMHYSRFRVRADFFWAHDTSTVLATKVLKFGKLPITYSKPNVTVVLTPTSGSAVYAVISVARIPEAESDSDGHMVLVAKQGGNTFTRYVSGAGPRVFYLYSLTLTGGNLNVVVRYIPKASTASNGEVSSVPASFPMPAPLVKIVSFVANDPDDGDNVFSTGDTVNVTLNTPVRVRGVALGESFNNTVVGQLFVFSQDIRGSVFSGVVEASGMAVVLTATTATSAFVGLTHVRLRPDAPLVHVPSSQPATPTTSRRVLTGDFGVAVSVFASTKTSHTMWETQQASLGQLGFQLSSDYINSVPTPTPTVVVSTSAGTLEYGNNVGSNFTVTGSVSEIVDVFQTTTLSVFHVLRAVVSVSLTDTGSGAGSHAVVVTVRDVPESPAIDAPVSLTFGQWVTHGALSSVTISDPDFATRPDATVTASLYVHAGLELNVTDTVSGVSTNPLPGVATRRLVIKGTVPKVNQVVQTMSVFMNLNSMGFGLLSYLRVVVVDEDKKIAYRFVHSVVDCSQLPLEDFSATAIMSRRGNKVTVTFSHRFYYAGGLVPVASLFDAATVLRLGGDARVMPAGGMKLYIFLTPSSTLVPGQNVTLLEGTLKQCPESVVSFPSKGITVAAPENPLVPVVRVIGQRRLGSCDDVRLYASVANLGGRPRSYSWSSETVDLSSVDTSGNRLTLPNELVAPGNHTVTLQVRNFVRIMCAGHVRWSGLRREEVVMIRLTCQ